MTPEQIARARWVQNSSSTMILKCCYKDGSAVLARITKYHHFLFSWELEQNKQIGGHVKTRYVAMRRARQALREATDA